MKERSGKRLLQELALVMSVNSKKCSSSAGRQEIIRSYQEEADTAGNKEDGLDAELLEKKNTNPKPHTTRTW